MCVKQIKSETTADNSKSVATPAPILLTRGQAAKVLNLSGVTIQRLVTRGHLPRVPGLRKILIPVQAVERFAATAQ